MSPMRPAEVGADEVESLLRRRGEPPDAELAVDHDDRQADALEQVERSSLSRSSSPMRKRSSSLSVASSSLAESISSLVVWSSSLVLWSSSLMLWSSSLLARTSSLAEVRLWRVTSCSSWRDSDVLSRGLQLVMVMRLRRAPGSRGPRPPAAS